MLVKNIIAYSACLCISSLSAEKSGAYVEGGFQYSNFSGTNATIHTSYPTYTAYITKPNGHGQIVREAIRILGSPGSATITTYNGNLYGIDLQVGYKQFFGRKKHFGLRYYGIFSGQGGNSSAIVGSIINQPSANLFYGVGIDTLFNFYEKHNRTFGIFAGIMIGGSSWIMGKSTAPDDCQWTTTNSDGASTCATMNQFYAQEAKSINNHTNSPTNPSGETATFSPTFVQFIFNVGLRTNFTKHQGFEFGVRIPTIDDPYFTIKRNTIGVNPNWLTGGKNSKETIVFRRNVSLYWNYVFNF
ncbi:outer membrane protein [Helicobacter felis]|uniref:OMP1494 n=1 Tax=Helicobacter felis TaxID=214 RepID=A0A1M4NH52_HELFE|nr:outer membrane protein [Helicobacter felis]SFZ71312.1 OMP1494 [Helicobacter felis]